MKYVILCLAMLCCLALAGRGHSTAAPALAPADPAVEPADLDIADDAGGEDYFGETCGSNVCGKGQTCCNASCGICVPKGMSCTQQAC